MLFAIGKFLLKCLSAYIESNVIDVDGEPVSLWIGQF